MTEPIFAAKLFLAAFGIGCLLGILYGFLRPLPFWLRDLIWITGLFYGWIYHSFALCRGDIRMGNALGILLGTVVWELTLGRFLRPLFRLFWGIVFRILGIFLLPLKKFLKKAKIFINFLLSRSQKIFTIKDDKMDGGADNGKHKKPI